MTFFDQVAYVLKRAIPDALDPIVRHVVGTTLPRIGDEERYRIAHVGTFSSRVAADLLAFGRNQRLAGALVIVDVDTARALYFREGGVVGADTNVVFERLGRVLLRAKQVDAEGAKALIEAEETSGVAAATAMLPPELAAFGLERRAWDVAGALFFVPAGHFLIVEGVPDLGTLPALALNPMDLAIEGLRRYDEWRNGPAGEPGATSGRRAPESRPPEAPATRDVSAKAADELLRQVLRSA